MYDISYLVLKKGAVSVPVLKPGTEQIKFSTAMSCTGPHQPRAILGWQLSLTEKQMMIWQGYEDKNNHMYN